MKKRFAIIGNPISHSLSPVLHNYWYKKYKIDADYSLMNIEESDLKSVAEKIRNKELDGINITLPYKQKIIPYLDQLINDAKLTNSVNTVFLDNSNVLIGENTDCYGLQAAYLKEIIDVNNKKALVMGAGGVSPSVILALKKSKIQKISLTNRTYEKSFFLKKKFNFIDTINWENLENEIANFDIIVNATSLGLKNSEDFQVDFSKVKNNSVFIDTIYNPLETKTLKFLKDKGVNTFNGLEMFIYQGQKSFYLWNKVNPEIDNELIDLLVSKLK